MFISPAMNDPMLSVSLTMEDSSDTVWRTTEDDFMKRESSEITLIPFSIRNPAARAPSLLVLTSTAMSPGRAPEAITSRMESRMRLS